MKKLILFVFIFFFQINSASASTVCSNFVKEMDLMDLKKWPNGALCHYVKKTTEHSCYLMVANKRNLNCYTNNSSGWACKSSFRKSGTRCIKKSIPANAYETANGWNCYSSYYKNKSKTGCLKIPANAIKISESSFSCKSGYSKNSSGTSCYKNQSASSTQKSCPGSYKSSWNNCIGSYTYDDGSKYIGMFKSGNFNGQGSLIYSDGNKYEGKFKNDYKDGQGTFTYSDGHKYIGGWKNNLKHGKGTLTWVTGERYVGSWQNGKNVGQGTLTLSNGNKVQGTFVNGKFQETKNASSSSNSSSNTRSTNNQDDNSDVWIVLGVLFVSYLFFKSWSNNKKKSITESKPKPTPKPKAYSFKTKDVGRRFNIVLIDQGSDEWLDWRHSGIGASDASTINGDNKFQSVQELLNQKINRENVTPNEKMKLGTKLEPEARKLYIEKTGINVKPLCLQDKQFDWLIASMDGISDDFKHIVEIKCGESAYWQANKGIVPDYYLGQLQHQMMITGLDEVDYWCYWPGQKGILQKVKRDDDYIKKLFIKEQEFIAKLNN